MFLQLICFSILYWRTGREGCEREAEGLSGKMREYCWARKDEGQDEEKMTVREYLQGADCVFFLEVREVGWCWIVGQEVHGGY